MKKVLLIAPPFYRLMGSHYNGLHLGIAYVAAVLKQNGYDVRLYNADYLDTEQYLNQRQLFENSPTYKVLLNDLGYPVWKQVEDEIARFAPDIVGITMLTTAFKAAQNVAQIAKRLYPGLKVVVGGVHPTLDPEEVLGHDEFDYAIRGEGEFSLLELVQGREPKDIQGLSYKKNGQLINNVARPFIKDLDILPFPSRDSFTNGANHVDLGYVMTGRGCPYSCSYCVSPKIWQRVTRFRSVPNVVDELEYLKSSFGSQVVRFVDDTFNLDKRRAKELCQRMIDKGLNLKWICEARVDRLDRDLVSLMVKAGCVRVKLGVESGSDRILKMVGKGFNTATIRSGVSIVKEFGLPLTVYLMVGFPGETDAELRQTIALAKELDADYYSLSVLSPYYGTQMWKQWEESGKKIDKQHWEYFYHQSQDMIVNDELNPKVVNEFLALNEREGKGRRL